MTWPSFCSSQPSRPLNTPPPCNTPSTNPSHNSNSNNTQQDPQPQQQQQRQFHALSSCLHTSTPAYTPCMHAPLNPAPTCHTAQHRRIPPSPRRLCRCEQSRCRQGGRRVPAACWAATAAAAHCHLDGLHAAATGQTQGGQWQGIPGVVGVTNLKGFCVLVGNMLCWSHAAADPFVQQVTRLLFQCYIVFFQCRL
jgi:hypothetical protein